MVSRRRDRRSVKGCLLGLGVHLISLVSLRLDCKRLQKPEGASMGILLLTGKEQNGGAFPSWGKKIGISTSLSYWKCNLILDMMGVWRVLRQEQAEQPFCGRMAWSQWEVVNDNKPNVSEGEWFSKLKWDLESCMTGWQGTWAVCD